MLLAINGMDGPAEQAMGRGLKAARLRQIKAHVIGSLAGDISIHAVAVTHHLTERYVQRLFEDEGTTFSTFVSHQRLARAYRMVQAPRHAGQSVSAIAYECGFATSPISTACSADSTISRLLWSAHAGRRRPSTTTAIRDADLG